MCKAHCFCFNIVSKFFVVLHKTHLLLIPLQQLFPARMLPFLPITLSHILAVIDVQPT